MGIGSTPYPWSCRLCGSSCPSVGDTMICDNCWERKQIEEAKKKGRLIIYREGVVIIEDVCQPSSPGWFARLKRWLLS